MVKRLKMKFSLATLLVFFMTTHAFTQDTIKVMHYNLLYYGKNVYDCTSSTNPVDAKNGYLKTIITSSKPDIFTVNELDGEDAYPVDDDATYLLNNALNVDGVTYYKRTDFPEIYLANTLFYNSNKLTLKNQVPLIFSISSEKIFNVYTFYYNSPDLSTINDTVFITCMVAHLKAGSSSEDIQERTTEADIVMDYFTGLGQRGNFLFMGDLNLYTSTEGAFQELINPTNSLYKFYDPANQIGAWNNNYDYRFYHTQSTHTSGECYSTGGMDDRFDFILASEYIMNGTQKARYVPGSYKVIGQDGSSFDSQFNTSTNTSVPADVALALYNMSDHLPVYLELEIDQSSGSDLNISNIYTNPASPNSGNATTIYATLTDKTEMVESLKILWGHASGNYPNSITMTASGNIYSGSISLLPSGTDVYYKITGYSSTDSIVISSNEYHYTVADPLIIGNMNEYVKKIKVTNPAHDYLFLSIDLFKELEIKVEIVSTDGQILNRWDLNNSSKQVETQLPIGNISNGVYIVRISSTNFFYSKTIVIQ